MEMDYETVICEKKGKVFHITLNRPERLNALSDGLMQDLVRAIEEAEGNDDISVLVVKGAGRAFSAGYDIMPTDPKRAYGLANPALDRRGLVEVQRTWWRIWDCPKPVIARVQGPAYGGGVGLIAACDMVIATFDARFALTEVKLGLIPAVISPHVIAAIGERYARRYMLTAEMFSAAEAYRIGLIHEMVADDASLDEAVGEWVDTLLKNGPQALAECKVLIRSVAGQPYSPNVIGHTVESIARVRVSPEGQEGLSAFLQKRKPNWVD